MVHIIAADCSPSVKFYVALNEAPGWLIMLEP